MSMPIEMSDRTGVESAFAGARYYACDLHAHTPSDRGWQGEPPGHDAGSRDRYAGRYVEACLNLGLEAIALVDHNFAPSVEDSFEPGIQREAKRQGLTVFPGVELASSEQIHVVVMFDPEDDFTQVIRFVSRVFGAQARFDDRHAPLPLPESMDKLLELVQKLRGFFYFPHANEKNGFLDTRGATAKRLYEEKTPMLALDLGDHPLELAPEVVLGSRIPGAVSGFKHRGWKRQGACRFPPALLWGSDGRALRVVAP